MATDIVAASVYHRCLMTGGLWKRLGRGFSLTFVASLATYASAFLLAPIYARVLSPVEYGHIAMANTLRGVAALLMGMGVSGAVVYWYNLYRNDPPTRRRAMGNIAGLGLVCSFVWLGIGLLVGPWLQARFLPEFALPFWPYGLVILATGLIIAVQSTPLNLLETAERNGLRAILNVSAAAAQAVWSLILVVALHRSVAGQTEATLLAAATTLPFFLYLCFKETPFSRNNTQWLEVARYALPLLPHSLFLWALNLSDRLIIGHYGERFAEDLGLYSFSCNLATLMAAVTTASSSIWAPVFLEQARSNPRVQTELGQTASWSIVALAFVAGGIILFSAEGLAILGGARYAPGRIYVAPVVLGYFVQSCYQIPLLSLYHVKRTSRMPFITLAGAATNVTLNLLLIPRYGVIVAAWSTLAGFAVSGVLYFIVGQGVFPLRYRVAPIVTAFVLLGMVLSLQSDDLGWLHTSVKLVSWFTAAGVVFVWFRRDHR